MPTESAYAALLASTIEELRACVAGGRCPAVIEHERAGAIQCALEAQSEEIANLRSECAASARIRAEVAQAAMRRAEMLQEAFGNQIARGVASLERAQERAAAMLRAVEGRYIGAAQFDNTAQENYALRAELDKLQAQVTELQKSNDGLRAQLLSAQMRSDDGGESSAGMLEKVRRYEQRIRELESKIRSANDEKNREDVERELELVNAEIERKNAIIKSKDEQIESLTSKVSLTKDSQRGEMEELSKKVQSLVSVNSQMSVLNHDLEAEVEELKKKLKESEGSKTLLNEMNLQMAGKIEDLELELSKKKNSPVIKNRDIENELIMTKDNLNTLRESFAKNQKQSEQQIQIFQKQLQTALNNSESLKQKIVDLTNSYSELENELNSKISEVSTIQRMLKTEQTKTEDLLMEIKSKDNIIEQIELQKGEIEEDYKELLEAQNKRKTQNEMFIISLGNILNCDKDIISERINNIISDNIKYKEIYEEYQTNIVQLNYFKSKLETLEEQNKTLESFTKSELEKAILCKEGEESKIVSGIRNDFKQLFETYSQLLEAQKELQANYFSINSKNKSLERKLKESDLEKEKFTLQAEEFSNLKSQQTHLIDFLSKLSQHFISNFPSSEARVISSLLTELRSGSTPSSIKTKWHEFSSLILERVSPPDTPTIHRRFTLYMQSTEQQMDLIMRRIEGSESSLSSLLARLQLLPAPRPIAPANTRKVSKLKPPTKSLFDHSLRTPPKKAPAPTHANLQVTPTYQSRKIPDEASITPQLYHY